MIKTVVTGLLCAAAALTAGILIGHYGIDKSSDSAPAWVKDVSKDVDENLLEELLSQVDNSHIQENLRSVCGDATWKKLENGQGEDKLWAK